MPSKKKRKKQQLKLFRWLFSLVIALVIFYLTENQDYEAIQSEHPPVLYSNVCSDNLQEIFLEAMNNAKHSILLIIYSLSDEKLIHALSREAERGIKVKVMHDTSTPSFGFQKLSSAIDVEGVKLSGLMHQKILVVDHEKVWLGSANMTTESLKLHDNLVIGLINPYLAEAIDSQKAFCSTLCGGQEVEYFSFPQSGKEGLKRIIQLIEGAKNSLKIAMFTWTHAELTESVIRAHHRGVNVEIILDQGQANGVCIQTLETLKHAHIDVRLSSGLGLLHHKFAWIDETFLINGSANWTLAAFSRNRDCLLILHPLTEPQNEKLHKLWKKTKAVSNNPFAPSLSLAA